MVDMAHFAGLVAAGLHPNPVPYADVVTTTIHKTLGGARGGMILCREEYAEEDQLGRLPGPAGRPARARDRRQGGRAARSPAPSCSASASSAPWRARKAVAEELLGAGNGVNVLTGGTDVHLVLVDLRESELDGQQAEDRLHDIGITVNRNAVPFDPRPPAVSSRPARRHAGAGHPRPAGRRLRARSARIIARALQPGFDDARDELAERVTAIADRYPLYAQLGVARPRKRRPPAASQRGRRRVAASADRGRACGRQPRRPSTSRRGSSATTRLERGDDLGGGRGGRRARARASRAAAPRAAPACAAAAAPGSRASCGKRTAGSARRGALRPRERPLARERVVAASRRGRTRRPPGRASPRARSHCSGAM